MKQAFICGAVRTPIGRYGGILSMFRAEVLAALPIIELIRRNPNVDWGAVEDVIYGCANAAGEDNCNVAREAGLLAGLTQEVPGTTLNFLCGASLGAVGLVARAIKAGEVGLMIAGGVESTTRAPLVLSKVVVAFSRGSKIRGTTIGSNRTSPLLKSKYGVDATAETAEYIAEQFKISRVDQDAFALRSQQRWAKSDAEGYFGREIVPVAISQEERGNTLLRTDEHPKPGATLSMFTKLQSVVKEGGTATVGNTSGINDGACAILLSSENAAAGHGLRPRARVVAMATVGVAPPFMGLGPAAAARKVLAMAKLKLNQMDVIELNEVSAAQGLAVTRDLGLPDDAPHVNPNGGAIAIGHPLGASGARLVITALNQLERSRAAMPFARCASA